MKRLIPLAVLGSVGALLGHSVLADSCKVTADRSATVDAGGVNKVVIETGAGELTVRGDSQASVRANGRACARTDKILQQIKLESRRDGTTVYIKTIIPESPEVLFESNPRLDLTVLVPKSVAIELEDSSGELELSNVQSAVVTDGSGEMEISNIAGNLRVSDGSGSIEIEQIQGNVSVEDSSGEIEIEDIKGDVEIPVDSSGEIRIERVAGGVHIRDDSSGSISIREVTRDVVIDSDSSGGIEVSQVGGNFTVGSDSSGGIQHSSIAGSIDIPSR